MILRWQWWLRVSLPERWRRIRQCTPAGIRRLERRLDQSVAACRTATLARDVDRARLATCEYTAARLDHLHQAAMRDLIEAHAAVRAAETAADDALAARQYLHDQVTGLYWLARGTTEVPPSDVDVVAATIRAALQGVTAVQVPAVEAELRRAKRTIRLLANLLAFHLN